jgi:hypothetical protein
VTRFLRFLLFGLAGYVVGAVAGFGLVVSASGNTHDRSLEAAMTALFVAGPIVAIVAGLIGATRRPPTRSQP